MTGVWALDRQGHDLGAGPILGTAAAIKLFPAYLGVYYLSQGSTGPRRSTGLAARLDPLTLIDPGSGSPIMIMSAW